VTLTAMVTNEGVLLRSTKMLLIEIHRTPMTMNQIIRMIHQVEKNQRNQATLEEKLRKLKSITPTPIPTPKEENG
jgi:hypothetical protein